VKRSNNGISNVLTTVILTSVMLLIVLSTSLVANNILNAQVERAQFDQTKNIILALDKIVKEATFKPQSSGYVRSSFWTTTPYLIETGESLQILFNQTLVYEVPLNLVKIQGGRSVSCPASEDLIGNASILLTQISESLGWVNVYQSNGAWVALDYGRVRCIYSGITELFNGTDYEVLNIVEIYCIKILFGPIEIQDNGYITAQNMGVKVNQSRFDNDFTIQVKNTYAEGSNSSISLSDLGGNPSYHTLINFVVVDIELSILGGG
jgi:hypothetical protein